MNARSINRHSLGRRNQVPRDRSVYIQAYFAASEDSLQATIDLPFDAGMGLVATVLTLEQPQLRFELAWAGDQDNFLGSYIPAYHDFASGRISAVFPASEETYFAGPASLVPYPCDVGLGCVDIWTLFFRKVQEGIRCIEEAKNERSKGQRTISD